LALRRGSQRVGFRPWNPTHAHVLRVSTHGLELPYQCATPCAIHALERRSPYLLTCPRTGRAILYCALLCVVGVRAALLCALCVV
jgi:hypothetical protein